MLFIISCLNVIHLKGKNPDLRKMIIRTLQILPRFFICFETLRKPSAGNVADALKDILIETN